MPRLPTLLICCLAGAACGATSDATAGGAGPAVVGVKVTPRTAVVRPGATIQFAASGELGDGSSRSVTATFQATGGSITPSGRYTAGAVPGTFAVIAHDPDTQLADTATISIGTAKLTAASYARVAGDDWQSYNSDSDLRGTKHFWWVDAAGRDVYDFVGLVSDPIWGKAVRITFPQNAGAPGSSPRIGTDLPAPLDRMWLRWTMKFTPGWTTVGPDPAGAANSYKIAFWLWQGHGGRGELEYSNTSDYITGTGVQDAGGNYFPYAQTLLPGSAANFGHTDTEWSDGEWWQFVVYYQRTGPMSARQYYWRRRLTSHGRQINNPWIFCGFQMAGYPTPQVKGVELGINKNKNNPTAMYITWGPWEVVDGTTYPNPFDMPHVLP